MEVKSEWIERMSSAAWVGEIVDTGIAIARQVAGALGTEQSKVDIKAHKLKALADGFEQDAAERKAISQLLRKVLWIPVIRGAAIQKQISLSADLTEKAFARRSTANRLRMQSSAIASQVTSANNIVRFLRKERGRDFGSIPMGVEIERRFESLRLQTTYVLRIPPGPAWNLKALKLSGDIAGALQGWTRSYEQVVALRAAQAKTSATIMSSQAERKVYLPIHKSLGPKAVSLGAKTDKNAPYGTSPWYVTTTDDLSRFRSMLPLAYRPKATQFKFHPVPYRASGLNLWTFFDQATWDLVRTTSYAMAGHRCVICGGRGGWISDTILDPQERRNGVECHEVWSWNSDDPASGIGIQKLERLMVLCSSCHATFHAGHFISKAKEKGMQDEVKEFIDRRRMHINRIDRDTLKLNLADAKQELLAIGGIDNWVVDLDYLGRQQFMADVSPVLRERNGPGIGGDLIAGVAFETESGEFYFNSSADEIVERLRQSISGIEFSGRSLGSR